MLIMIMNCSLYLHHFRELLATQAPKAALDAQETKDRECVKYMIASCNAQLICNSLKGCLMMINSSQGVAGNIGSPGQKGEVGYPGPYVRNFNFYFLLLNCGHGMVTCMICN